MVVPGVSTASPAVVLNAALSEVASPLRGLAAYFIVDRTIPEVIGLRLGVSTTTSSMVRDFALVHFSKTAEIATPAAEKLLLSVPSPSGGVDHAVEPTELDVRLSVVLDVQPRSAASFNKRRGILTPERQDASSPGRRRTAIECIDDPFLWRCRRCSEKASYSFCHQCGTPCSEIDVV
jgi:hypothetical protein